MSSALQYYATFGDAAARETVAEWRAAHPGMGLFALVAEADREREVPAVQQLCRSLDLPVVGAVFPQLVYQSRFLDRGGILMRFDRMPFAGLYGPFRPPDPSGAGVCSDLASDIRGRLGRVRSSSLFLIFDAMVSNVSTILDELYLALADRVRYMGVNAGSETFRPMPCLFDSTQVAQDGALAMLLDDHPGAAVEHCYQAPERLISATATEGNRIISIDWRPAFEVYQETVRAEYGISIDRENFYRYASHFPFGIVRADELVVRIPVALQPDGSLFCVGEVPANAVLTLLRAPEVDSVRTVDTLCEGLRSLSGEMTGADMLTFYCAGRKIHLGDRAEWELAELHKRTGASCMAGALSLGEIGHSRHWGYPLFHNGALLCCRW